MRFVVTRRVGNILQLPPDGSVTLVDVLYEALDEARSHAICLASSEDDGATWARISQVLRPSGDGWDSGAVSRPYLVPADPTDPTSRARLYYLGRSADGARQGIGVAESDDPEWRKWTKL